MRIREYYTKPPQEGQTSRVVAVQYLLKGKKRTGPIYDDHKMRGIPSYIIFYVKGSCKCAHNTLGGGSNTVCTLDIHVRRKIW